MKPTKSTLAQKPKPVIVPPSAAVKKTTQGQVDLALALSPDTVARKAYFSYVNEGALPGRDVQHWLAAEKELIEECNLNT